MHSWSIPKRWWRVWASSQSYGSGESALPREQSWTGSQRASIQDQNSQLLLIHTLHSGSYRHHQVTLLKSIASWCRASSPRLAQAAGRVWARMKATPSREIWISFFNYASTEHCTRPRIVRLARGGVNRLGRQTSTDLIKHATSLQVPSHCCQPITFVAWVWIPPSHRVQYGERNSIPAGSVKSDPPRDRKSVV